MSILEELKWRGLVADCTDAPELTKKISAPVTLYCGFDPTADSLHVGNLVPLLALRRFQLLGHHSIAVAGGATGMVGDPSGKTQERQLLTPEVLAHNISSVKEQLKRLLDFDAKQNPARLVDNASWTANVSYLDFLRDVGKHFSVNQMVAKESVRARMEDRETGISYTEFSYMLLQAFDFLVLYEKYGCELQIGGSDQWGNITAGIDLVRKKLGKTAYGLTLPLITNANGTKFGKTEAGAIWLDSQKTSVDEFYQFWVRTDDHDVIRYLKFFTFLKREEILDLEEQQKNKPEARIAHKVLAKEMTDLIHPVAIVSHSPSPSSSAIAQRVADILFAKIFSEYAESDFVFLSENSASLLLEKVLLEKGVSIVELLIKSGLCSSKGQARKDIEGGGIYLGSKHTGISECVRTKNAFLAINDKDLVFGKYLLLRKGKKNYVVVTAK